MVEQKWMTETLWLDGADEGGPPVTAYAAAAPVPVVDLTKEADSDTERYNNQSTHYLTAVTRMMSRWICRRWL